MKRCFFLAFASLILLGASILVGSPTASASDDSDDDIQVQNSSDDVAYEVGQDKKGKKGGMKGKGKGKKGMGKGKGKGKFPPPGMKKGKKKTDTEELVLSAFDRQVSFVARLETPVADRGQDRYHVLRS